MVNIGTRLIAALLSLCGLSVAGSALYYQFRGHPENALWIGPLLSQGSASDHILPWLILGSLAVLLAMTAGLTRHVFSEWRALATFPTEPAEALSRRRQSSATIGGSGVDRRVRWILNQIHNPASRSRLTEFLQAEASLDAVAVANAYVPLRVFVWLLPVLGFVGTAWAMSLAIGSFSQALSEVTDTRGLTLRLSQLVIPSLAHAFHITMFALSAAIVGYVCTSALQAAHEDVIEQLDRKSLELVALLLPPAAGTPDLVEIFTNLNSTMASLAMSLNSQGMHDDHRAVLAAAEQLHSASTAVHAASANLSTAAEMLTRELQKPLTVTLAREGSR